VTQTPLFGDDRPDDLALGIIQRAVVRKMRRLGPMFVDEIGAVAHVGRGRHSVDEVCRFCGIDGQQIAEALWRRGLIERAPEGAYRIRPSVPATGVSNELEHPNEERP
jgi:predicted transcriptional regulator of viral defense system